MTPKAQKILLVITKSNWGGAQAYVHTLATYLQGKDAYSVAVALGGTGENGAPTGRLAHELSKTGIRTFFVPSFTRDVGLLRELRAIRELYQILRAERPDVVHLNSSKAGGIGALAARLASIPSIIFTSHGLAYDEDRSLAGRAIIWLATWVTILLCHRVIVISQNTFERARRLPFCRKKVYLIYNGITATSLLSRADAQTQLLPDQTAHGSVWIGTIAELTRNKDLPSLLSAAQKLKARGHIFTLCVMGVGDERQHLESLIGTYHLQDYVHLLGFVPHAARYLQAFDIFTLVSIKEGLPYVLLEAGLARCAVVATEIPGTTDIIDQDTGLLVPPKSPSRIADALEMLINSPKDRVRLGQAVHARITQRFSIDQMLAQTCQLYEPS